jgi:NADH:ubiquinone oxidoreductase subunit F (NADH-binding)
VTQRHYGRGTVAVQVVRLPRRFLSGQSSALARYVGGGAVLPVHQDPPVRERGVRRAPTLVQNVETLAQLALVARYRDSFAVPRRSRRW